MICNKRRARGYTAVELMMAIGIFGLGVAGIISMQKVTAVSNQHAKNLGIATHIAESWLDMLATDAVTWNQPSSSGGSVPDIGQTIWLQSVTSNADAATNWILPTYSTPMLFGPAFDSLGNAVDAAVSPGRVAFCSHLRLSWLIQPTSSGNGMIRAEVRVFWLRDGQGFTQNMCSAAQVANVGAAPQTFHFVQKITAIRENDR